MDIGISLQECFLFFLGFVYLTFDFLNFLIYVEIGIDDLQGFSASRIRPTEISQRGLFGIVKVNRI